LWKPAAFECDAARSAEEQHAKLLDLTHVQMMEIQLGWHPFALDNRNLSMNAAQRELFKKAIPGLVFVTLILFGCGLGVYDDFVKPHIQKTGSTGSREHERNSDAIADIGLQLLKRKDALALCEEVSDVEVTSVTSGSASPYNGPNRVPAYIVDYRLGCYSAYNGKSTQLWRIGFAKDAHTGDFYCMKWGDAEFRDEVQEALKASCSFTSP
jgi:hypothetical protein